jgi:hypothetical protein
MAIAVTVTRDVGSISVPLHRRPNGGHTVTVIAALADGHTVWMAADTAEHVSGTLAGTARKIRRVNLPHYAGTILLGVAGAGGLAVAARTIEHPAPDVNLIPDGDLDTWADNLAVYLTGIAKSWPHRATGTACTSRPGRARPQAGSGTSSRTTPCPSPTG